MGHVFQCIAFMSLLSVQGFKSFSTTAQPMKLIFPDETSEEVRSCPGRTWFHNESQSCWPSRKQGPCPESMIFYPIDKKYGDCDCPVSDRGTVWVYNLESDRCFKTYEQANCPEGEWLAFGKSDAPECTQNPCEKLQQESQEENKLYPVVQYNGKCVRLEKSIEDESCRRPAVIAINYDTGRPVCSLDLTNDRNVGVTGSFKCRQGTRRDRLGKCRPVNNKVSFRPPSASAS